MLAGNIGPCTDVYLTAEWICRVKSVQSALSDLLTTSATHGTFSRPGMKRGLISIIKLMQFTIVRFFQASLVRFFQASAIKMFLSNEKAIIAMGL